METREKLVYLADQMIRKRGYNAFSYKDLSVPMHVKNAAIHYYFPTKADLGIAVIDQTIQRFAQNKAAWEKLPEDEQLRRFAQMYAHDQDTDLICLMGSLSPDYQTLPEKMQAKVKQMGEDILDWLTNCLNHGRERGLLHFNGEPYDRALLVVSTLLSALLLSRVLGEDTYERMHQQVLRDVIIENF